ncbi:MAG: hypothetical protein D3924_13520 [Candidatus Electrothrix sp. AR4]|nr:hypothetical protein [Candidatus Electrothrix sp. AR4]
MSGDEVRFLPFEEALAIVGAIQEEEDVDDEKHRIFTVYSKEDKELCWFDFDEVVRDVEPVKGDKGKEQVTEYILHHIPDWALDII